MITPITNILKKLKTIFWWALNGNKGHAALQVQGKSIGMYLCEVMPIWDITQEQLRKFINVLKKLNPELKNQGGASLEGLLKKKSDWNHSQPELKPPQPVTPPPFALSVSLNSKS